MVLRNPNRPNRAVSSYNPVKRKFFANIEITTANDGGGDILFLFSEIIIPVLTF
jgi:hypothetical protein